MPLHSGLVDEYRKQFTQMDQDESGFVSREELQSLLLDMGHSEGEVREKFSQMDANQDDKGGTPHSPLPNCQFEVSFDEFIGLVEKLTMGRDASELEEIFKLADEEAMGFIPFETLKSILVDIIGSEERVSRGLRALRINEDEHIDCEQFIEIANSI